jgi:hypothetical protein
MGDSTVAIYVADLEPVSSFIAKVARAEAWFRQMSADEVLSLPKPALAGFNMLQGAVRDLAGCVPTMAGILADPQED